MAQEISNKESIWNRRFITILAVNFLFQMGQQMTNTLVPKYANSLGTSAYLIGLLSTAFAVSSLIVRPVTSPAFDSFSRKKLLIATICGLVVVFFGYGMSMSIVGLFAARVLHGACIGCIATLSLVIASDSLPDSQLGKGIGFFSLCQAVGQAIGPNFGLMLSELVGYRFMFFTGGSLMLLGLAVALTIQEPVRQRDPYQIKLDKIIERDSLHPAVMMFFIMAANMCLNTFLVIYAGLLGVGNIGLYFTVYAVCLLVTRPVSGTLIDRLGYAKVVIPGLICFACSFLIIFFSNALLGFLIAAVVNALGFGVCYPAVQSMSMSAAAKNRRGAAGSTSYLGADLAALTGPFLAGLLIDKITSITGSEVTGYSYVFIVMIAPIVFCLIYFVLAKKKINENIKRNSQPQQSTEAAGRP